MFKEVCKILKEDNIDGKMENEVQIVYFKKDEKGLDNDYLVYKKGKNIGGIKHL